MSYKDTAIQQAEQAIDSIRKRRKNLEAEIAEMEQNENEARAVLQLLKTGNAPQMRNGKRVISSEEFLEAVGAAGVDGQEFTPGDIAELLGTSSTSMASRLKRHATDDMYVEMVAAGGPGVPSKFKLKT